jgi:hypothetical protein
VWNLLHFHWYSCFLILSTSESLPLRGWIVDIMVTGELSIHSKVAAPSLTAPLRK